MPPLPIIANTFRVALKWNHATTGQNAVNVMHFQSGASGQTASNLFTVLDAHVTQVMWDAVIASARVAEVDITPLDGTSATQSFQPAGLKWSGGGGGADFIPNSSVILKLQTGRRGRSYRGRIFFPMVPENACSDGAYDNTVAASIQAAWVTFVGAITGLSPTWDLGVASYKLSHFEGVTAVTCETVLATQRRRQSRLRGS